MIPSARPTDRERRHGSGGYVEMTADGAVRPFKMPKLPSALKLNGGRGLGRGRGQGRGRGKDEDHNL